MRQLAHPDPTSLVSFPKVCKMVRTGMLAKPCLRLALFSICDRSFVTVPAPLCSVAVTIPTGALLDQYAHDGLTSSELEAQFEPSNEKPVRLQFDGKTSIKQATKLRRRF